jgi:hypothetical protein
MGHINRWHSSKPKPKLVRGRATWPYAAGNANIGIAVLTIDFPTHTPTVISWKAPTRP